MAAEGSLGLAAWDFHPGGGIISTMLPHLGQDWIVPMSASLRIVSRAWQVVQAMEKSGSATRLSYRPRVWRREPLATPKAGPTGTPAIVERRGPVLPAPRTVYGKNLTVVVDSVRGLLGSPGPILLAWDRFSPIALERAKQWEFSLGIDG